MNTRLCNAIIGVLFAVFALCGAVSRAQEPYATPAVAIHSADLSGDGHLTISELLRVIQLFNFGGYHCAASEEDTEDGYRPGLGAAQDCAPHDSDYDPQDWTIGLGEVLRLVQFYSVGGYYGPAFSEDGFLPRGALPDTYLIPLPDDSTGNHLTDGEEAAMIALGFDPEAQDGIDLALELHALLEAVPYCAEPFDLGCESPNLEPPVDAGLCRCFLEAEHEEFDGVTGTLRSAVSVVLLNAEGVQVYRMGILGRTALEAGSFNAWDCGPSSPGPFDGVCTSYRQDVVLLYELLKGGE